MSLKKSAILAVLLVGLLVYIMRVVEPAKEAEKQEKLIFRDLAKDKITLLHVVSKNGEYNLEQIAAAEPTPKTSEADDSLDQPVISEGGKWQLVGAENAPIDQAKVASIVAAITNLSSEGAIAAEDIDKDQKLYGLSEPEMTIELKTSSKNYTIKFGKENAYVGKRYVSIEPDGPALMMAPDSLLVTAGVKVDQVKSKSPIMFPDTEVKSIEIKAKKESVKVERVAQGDKSWKVTAPIEAKASDKVISQLMRDLRNLHTEEFNERTPQAVTADGLDTPLVELQVEFLNQHKPINVKIAPAKAVDENKPAYFIVDDQPAIYKATNFDQTTLVKSALELRDREMFAFDRSKLEKLTFKGAGDQSEHELVKLADGKWSIDGKPADSTFVIELLGNLNALKADGFESAAASIFDKPQLKLELKLATGAQSLLVGGENEVGSKQYFARSSSRAEDFIISADTMKLITPRVDVLLMQPTPTPAPVSAAASELTPTTTPGQVDGGNGA